MLDIALIIAPLFILIGLGFISIKVGVVKPEALVSVGNIVLYFAMPAVMISSVGQAKFSDVLEPWYLLTYAVASLIMLILGLISGRVFQAGGKKNLSSSGIQALGMASPNSMFVGLPLLLLIFPDNPPTIAFVMAVLVENFLTIPIALLMLEIGASREQTNGQVEGWKIWKLIASRLVKNPLIVSIVIGVSISALELTIPSPIKTSLDMLMKMSATLALFFIGMTLAINSLQRITPAVSSVAIGKLILHPVLAILLIAILPDFDPVLQAAVVIICAAPMITIYPILGAQYGFRQFCVNTIILAMIASFFTLVVILDWMKVLN